MDAQKTGEDREGPRRGMAEGVGFEPTEALTSHAFQACPFGRSGNPPDSRLRGFGPGLGVEGYRVAAAPASGCGGRVLCDGSL